MQKVTILSEGPNLQAIPGIQYNITITNTHHVVYAKV